MNTIINNTGKVQIVPAIINSQLNHISLKKELNDFMQTHIEGDECIFEAFRNRFNRCISFIYARFGENAFYNLQKDLSVIRKKFYPTVFDSIMIATDIALSRGYNSLSNLEGRRLELFKDPSYSDSITQGTMKTDNIRTRISKVLVEVYNMQLNNE